MRRKPALVAAVAATVLAFEAAHAQRIPTDIELKAAYCLKVTQASVAELGRIAPTDAAMEKMKGNALRNANDRVNRLQLYLVPRMQALEPTAMIGAMNRGEADAANYFRRVEEIADKCTTSCQLAGATGEAKDKAVRCFTACIGSDELLTRISSCPKLNWLPF